MEWLSTATFFFSSHLFSSLSSWRREGRGETVTSRPAAVAPSSFFPLFFFPFFPPLLSLPVVPEKKDQRG